MITMFSPRFKTSKSIKERWDRASNHRPRDTQLWAFSRTKPATPHGEGDCIKAEPDPHCSHIYLDCVLKNRLQCAYMYISLLFGMHAAHMHRSER